MVVRHTARRRVGAVVGALALALASAAPSGAAVGVIRPGAARAKGVHRGASTAPGRRAAAKAKAKAQARAAIATTAPSATASPGVGPVTTSSVTSVGAAARAVRLEPFLSRPALAPGWTPAELDRVTRTWFGDHPDIDSAVVTAEAGGSTWSVALRRRGTAADVAPDAPYLALSITKTVTAALVLREVEKGSLSLDGALPEVSGITAPEGVSVRNLLAHESGLADYRESTSYDLRSFIGPREAVQLSLHAPRVSEPGTSLHYANSNFLYLQLILEKVTGRPYERLLAELVGSVGLQHTDLRPADRPGWPAGAAGGMWSTTEDLVTWMSSLFTPGVVLSEPMLRQLAAFDGRQMTLGLWRICPCWAGAGGAQRFTAIGHHVAVGGAYYLPEVGASVAVHIGPSGDVAAGETADLVVRLAELAGAPRR